MEERDMKKTMMPESSKAVYEAKKFLKRRGLSTDGTNLMRELLETRQRWKHLEATVEEPEVAEMIGDFLDYIECEVKFLHEISQQ
jgi:hypothetical protein